MIPSEWQAMRIGDLFESKAGGDFDPTRSSAAQSESHPYPIYANGLSQEGIYGFCDYAENRPGSITVTARGTLGRAFFRDTSFVAIGRLLVLEPKVRMDARYFSEYINHGVHFAVESTGVPQLTAPQVARYLLPVPPESEQRAIAKAMSDVDGLLATLEALIAKKQAIKQAAMQQLLTGKTRLPGFSGEWEIRPLGYVLSVRHGKSQVDVVCPDGTYPILASGGEIGRTDSFLYDKPSVLIGRKGTIDNPQFVSSPFWAIDTLFYTEIADKMSAKFLYYKFCTIPWRSCNEASGVPSLNAQTIENIEVRLPKADEQTAIATILFDMDTEITALEAKLSKAHLIKQGMMQALLTGRIRLV